MIAFRNGNGHPGALGFFQGIVDFPPGMPDARIVLRTGKRRAFYSKSQTFSRARRLSNITTRVATEDQCDERCTAGRGGASVSREIYAYPDPVHYPEFHPDGGGVRAGIFL